MTDEQRAKQEQEREKARAIRKASLEHWTEKYRYFSHPPADKIGQVPCGAFDKMKSEEMWERYDRGLKELADTKFRVRPCGAFKQLITDSTDPTKAMVKKDVLSFEQTMARCRTYADLSRQKTWHQNRPTWEKYKYYNGGSQSSNRFSNWMGQFSGKDPTTRWMETRLEDLRGGAPGSTNPPSLRATESYHPFHTVEFKEAAGEAANGMTQAGTNLPSAPPVLGKSMSSPKV